MNYDDKALEVLSNSIKLTIQEYLANAPFDKTVEGRIVASLGNNLYTVQLNGNNYNIKSYSGVTYSVNNIVRITIPQNDYKNMYIIHLK